MRSGGFLSNASWMLGGQILRMLISLAVSVLTARFLGPSDFGIIHYVTSYITFFTTLIGLGLSGVIVYELVRRPEEEGDILGSAILLRFLAGVVSVLAFLPLVRLTDGRDGTVLAVAALQAVQLPFLAFDTVRYFYQARMQARHAVQVQTAAYLIMAGYKVYLLATGKSVEWFAFATSLDVLCLALFYLILYRRRGGPRLRVSRSAMRRLLRTCGPFLLADLMVVIYGQMDKIMLRQMMDSTEVVGLYSAALAISTLIGFLPIAILDAARPLIVSAKEEDEATYRLRLRRLYAALILLNLLYSLGVTVLARLVILILYGEAYLGARLCLRIVVWYTAFSYLGAGRNLYLICEGKNRYVFVFSALGAVSNLLLNLLLIPRFGINGAAAATLVTQVLSNLLFPLLFRGTRGYVRLVCEAVLLRGVRLRELFRKRS